ncbi:MAG: helix-turn-helix transcriptional regulator, partial [Hyphomonadaceae bacterium]|nr:helix-turn-helix transcriptional regulator [Clostridia bacterium]
PHAYDFYAENSLQALFIHPLLEAIPSVSIPPVTDGKNMQFLFEQLLDLFINRNEVNLLLQKAIVLQIIYQIITAVTPQYNHTNLPPSPHHKTLKKVLNYIERNFHQPIQLKDLASLAQLSPAHLHKIFTKTLAITPNQFILNRRLQKAKECLLKTDVAIYTVADLCGFQNAAYFTTVFHQVVGCTPSEFRLKSSYL